jgi:Sec-independent protein translocase protein TatA
MGQAVREFQKAKDGFSKELHKAEGERKNEKNGKPKTSESNKAPVR